MEKRQKSRPAAIFLAAPMSGFDTDAEYRLHRAVVNQACDLLEEEGHKVYFAGRAIASQAYFAVDKAEAFRHDYSHLVGCDFFALYYPKPVRSSVLVETGMAIGLGKPCVLVAQDTKDLVYLLHQAGQASGSYGIPPISIKEFGKDEPSGSGLAALIGQALDGSPADALSATI